MPTLNPEQIEAAIAELQTLKTEVEQLQALHDSSDERLEQLEIMDFQKQLNALESKYKTLDSSLLDTRRFLCMMSLDMIFAGIVTVQKLTHDPKRREKARYLQGSREAVMRQLQDSIAPEDIVTATFEDWTKQL